MRLRALGPAHAGRTGQMEEAGAPRACANASSLPPLSGCVSVAWRQYARRISAPPTPGATPSVS